MWDGFFSPRVYEYHPCRLRRGWDSETSLAWKTIQNVFSRILSTVRHVGHANYTALSWRSWKPYEMDLSHNCSLLGGKSEVCENYFSVISHKILKPIDCILVVLQQPFALHQALYDIHIYLVIPSYLYIHIISCKLCSNLLLRHEIWKMQTVTKNSDKVKSDKVK